LISSSYSSLIHLGKSSIFPLPVKHITHSSIKFRLFWAILVFWRRRKKKKKKNTPQNPDEVLPAVIQVLVRFCYRFKLLLKFKRLGKVRIHWKLKLQILQTH